MSYLKEQIITYMGNKRKLLNHIEDQILIIKNILQKDKLTSADAFSGSGVVSRLLKTHSTNLYTNDIAGYSKTLNECYLFSPNEKEKKKIDELIKKANTYVETNPDVPAYISKHWAPNNDKNIEQGERVYFTNENAKRIDAYKYFIDNYVENKYKSILLANLIVKASIHTNTNGQFSAFYKNGSVGAYGGKNKIDLQRITKKIKLEMPLFEVNKCKINISQCDTNLWVKNLPKVDLMYLDPPYNKHPYVIYYFLLDIINNWNSEQNIPNTTRGQPKNWQTSEYNSFTHAEKAFTDLINNINAKFILLSYNNGGIIPLEKIQTILEKKGKVEKIPVQHKTYNRLKGIANYKKKSEKESIKEYMWLVNCY